MKKEFKMGLMACAAVMIGSISVMGMRADAAADSDAILDGIYVGDISIAGMTEGEATQAVQDYVSTLQDVTIQFTTVGDNVVSTTMGDLGLAWDNQEVIADAAGLGKDGNIVQRYKAVKDLQYGNKIYELELSLAPDSLSQFIEEKCSVYDVKAEDMQLTRENGQFQISGGQTGMEVNEADSIQMIKDFIANDWDYKDASLTLVIDETDPRGSEEDLAKVKDVLGTFTTSYSTSGKARSANVANGCSLINGTVLYPGDEFSTYNTIKPFSEENGYYLAGSYLNGQVVESLGGGICQVSTTLYNAVLLSELDVTERHNHSMIISYVKPSMDAAIAESSGKDFKFVNSTDYPIYIEGHTENKNISFTVYGVETRDSGHKVSYESETLSKTEPDTETIIQDSGQGVGYISTQSAHIGYKAQLWKIVTENGQEVSREVINKSTYNPSPRSCTVGVNTDNASYAARIQAAIATGSIDEVKAAANAIKSEIQSGGTTELTEEQKLALYYQALEAQQAAADAAAGN